MASIIQNPCSRSLQKHAEGNKRHNLHIRHFVAPRHIQTPRSMSKARTITAQSSSASSGRQNIGVAANRRGLSKWDTQVWVTPALHNKNAVRLLALVAAVGIVAGGGLFIPSAFLKLVHLMAFATWFGTTIWTTFIGGIMMFKNLPRQTFGKLQSKLFPMFTVYFQLSAFCLSVSAASLLALQAGTFTSLAPLVTALVTVVTNLFVFEPMSTNVMLRRYALENGELTEEFEGEEESLKKEFGKWHGLSSLTNLIGICGGISYAWVLANMIKP